MYPTGVHVYILRDAVKKRARSFIIPSQNDFIDTTCLASALRNSRVLLSFCCLFLAQMLAALLQPLWIKALQSSRSNMTRKHRSFGMIVCVAVRQSTVLREAWPETECWDDRSRRLVGFLAPALRPCCETNWFDRGTRRRQWWNPSVYSTGD